MVAQYPSLCVFRSAVFVRNQIYQPDAHWLVMVSHMSIIVVVDLVQQYAGTGAESHMLFEQEIDRADNTDFVI